MNHLDIENKFKDLFGGQPRLYRAPGRINLIGEHTDYNDGFVLPASIDKNVVFAIGKNNLDLCRFYAIDLGQSFESNIHFLQSTSLNWPNYLLGVVDQLKKRDHQLGGFDCVFGSDIPIGAGLSSSAAIESGLAVALNEIFECNESKLDIVKLSQKAENEFVGVNCGIMDQFASVFGKNDHVFRLDCRSLDFIYYPLVLQRTGILLIDTQIKHELASSEYNTRRKECESGIRIISENYPDIRSLRDVSPEILQEFKNTMNPVIFKRCFYVVHEIERVIAACDDLTNRKIADFGVKMYETHAGLSDDYEVSCPELDFLVNQTMERDDVLGARMMGGGFGGCTINLVNLENMSNFKETISQSYQTKFKKKPLFYEVAITDGVTEIMR